MIIGTTRQNEGDVFVLVEGTTIPEWLNLEFNATVGEGIDTVVAVAFTPDFATTEGIVAIGNDSNPLIPQTTPELEVNKWGNIVVDDNGKTSLDRIYAGGDIVLGAATVILAMGEGRRAAVAINELLA